MRNLFFNIKYKLGFYNKITDNRRIVRSLYWNFDFKTPINKMIKYNLNSELRSYIFKTFDINIISSQSFDNIFFNEITII